VKFLLLVLSASSARSASRPSVKQEARRLQHHRGIRRHRVWRAPAPLPARDPQGRDRRGRL